MRRAMSLLIGSNDQDEMANCLGHILSEQQITLTAYPHSMPIIGRQENRRFWSIGESTVDGILRAATNIQHHVFHGVHPNWTKHLYEMIERVSTTNWWSTVTGNLGKTVPLMRRISQEEFNATWVLLFTALYFFDNAFN